MNTKYYKKYIEKLINSNPASIVLTREIKTDDGYGGHTTGTKTITARVSIYEKKSRREVITESGVHYSGIRISKVLASFDTDIKSNDEFEYQGNLYKVISINPYMDVCKQAEIEVIGKNET